MCNAEQPEPPGQCPYFPTTRWSVVSRAGTGPQSDARRALEQLLRAYLPALRAHLVLDRRLDPERADDVLQAFVAEKFVEQNLAAAADPARGRFRNFLLVALQRFAIDRDRAERTRRRSPGRHRLEPLDEHHTNSLAAQDARPVEAFERAWANEVLHEVMRRMRRHCEDTDQSHLWAIFEARVLLPITEGATPPGHDELARRHRLPSAAHASNALGSAKRMFTRIFRDVVGEYANDDAEIDAELRDLWDVLSRPA